MNLQTESSGFIEEIAQKNNLNNINNERILYFSYLRRFVSEFDKDDELYRNLRMCLQNTPERISLTLIETVFSSDDSFARKK